jgi:hypothetical protein
MMILYNDEEQGTGGHCELLKHEIGQMEWKLGLSKRQCEIVYERLLSYQVLLFDPRSKKLLRERPVSKSSNPILSPNPPSSEDSLAEAVNDKVNEVFQDQTNLQRDKILGRNV